MSARKLSDSEKKEILRLYRTSGETSSSLAVRYGVSTSTVSRMLKSTLPAEEYEALIQQKRSPRPNDTPQSPKPREREISQAAVAEVQQLLIEAIDKGPPTAAAPSKAPIRRSKQRPTVEPTDIQSADEEPIPTPVAAIESPRPKKVVGVTKSVGRSKPEPQPKAAIEEAEVLKEILSDTLIDGEEEVGDEDEELDDLDIEDDDEDEDELEGDLSEKPLFVGSQLKDGAVVRVQPLVEATLPRTCYLVVDRSAELIAPPLKDFGDLGQIPETEVQEKTLPIFDNHRVAKRYSNPRTQRVIKLPDGKILWKTSSHLQAKGITRLLIDGRVYAL